ncbi:MAG: general secretion pathway protein GspK [Lysobacterales bacterium CG17_big_fil_post_rev_8_21_14_2_50_64_11]|nr:MAG: general secretion pathway protein GspK [Xanthomonadales bacterium CG17_big_fil_post_rev_8_21_14_2_50_64_11]PIX60926.1 MAG: general secretion pathway protein GspK [Xanthomonadales bacterium CG_4_10_14_3_um_filter_64_11]
MSAHRGVALVLVLWLLVLLIALAGTFVVISRTEYQQGVYARGSVQARYAAQAAIELAAARMLDPDLAARLVPDGRVYRFALGSAQIELSASDETSRFDLNASDAVALSLLFQALGEPEDRALALADAIVDWRDPDDLLQINGAEDPQYADAGLPYGARDSPFETVEELQQVLGMDYETFLKVQPYVTVYSASAPRPDLAGAPVLQALGVLTGEIPQFLADRAAWMPGRGEPPLLPGGAFITASGSGMYSISALASAADGSRARLTQTVRVGSAGQGGQAYVLLSRREGMIN